MCVGTGFTLPQFIYSDRKYKKRKLLFFGRVTCIYFVTLLAALRGARNMSHVERNVMKQIKENESRCAYLNTGIDNYRLSSHEPLMEAIGDGEKYSECKRSKNKKKQNQAKQKDLSSAQSKCHAVLQITLDSTFQRTRWCMFKTR